VPLRIFAKLTKMKKTVNYQKNIKAKKKLF